MWRKPASVVLLLAVTLSAVSEEPRAEIVAGDEDAAWENWERIGETLISLDFKEVPLDQAVARIAELAKANVVITNGAREKARGNADGLPAVTLKLNSVPVIAALEVLAESVGLAIEPRPPVILLVEPSQEAAGEIEVRAGAVTMRFNLTARDLPAGRRREIVERAVEAAERQAEMMERQAERVQQQRGQQPMMNPEMLDKMGPEVRERMMKMMEKMQPPGEARGKKRLPREKPGKEDGMGGAEAGDRGGVEEEGVRPPVF
ncbi:MAG: hypothetical protein JW909_04700 [Planctomycetes bacterium]|nr:hypothetical protein [Planctomycetota bacterium]